MEFSFKVNADNIEEAKALLFKAFNPQIATQPAQTKKGKSISTAPVTPEEASLISNPFEAAYIQLTETASPEKTESVTTEQPKITPEMIRAKWGAISKSGYQEKLRAVVAEYNVKTIMDIPADKYPELIQKADQVVAELVKTLGGAAKLPDLLKQTFGVG